jgi:anti-sigma B factor antagonist
MRRKLKEAPMQITQIRLDQEISHVALTGRLDAAGLQGSDIKFTGFTAARRKPTLVDLSGVEFIASLGVGLLINCAKSLAQHGTLLVLLSPSEPVEKVLRTLGIDQVIPIAGTLEEGLRLLGQAA